MHISKMTKKLDILYGRSLMTLWVYHTIFDGFIIDCTTSLKQFNHSSLAELSLEGVLGELYVDGWSFSKMLR